MDGPEKGSPFAKLWFYICGHTTSTHVPDSTPQNWLAASPTRFEDGVVLVFHLGLLSKLLIVIFLFFLCKGEKKDDLRCAFWRIEYAEAPQNLPLLLIKIHIAHGSKKELWDYVPRSSNSMAWTKVEGSKGAMASNDSPTPKNFTGKESCFWMAITTPPFADPSSLVSTNPETPIDP